MIVVAARRIFPGILNIHSNIVVTLNFNTLQPETVFAGGRNQHHAFWITLGMGRDGDRRYLLR